ncbi:conserved exported hypothetical protein [Paraburkholderia ribeironis]|uniref:Uncharacterized protein n=1 Tax=Paraburkholderia ribeironis TaxID=1247936 RepID=A0A1N7RVW0_9BURK|nr:hypothetical protein [Paraburkholderia ribeironis]SIT39227.1 conserved exported hypothetical protein [Paraburkholderia ribeironis]
MKPVTVDILRAHLLAASLTAMGAGAVVCAALVLPVQQSGFGSMSVRLCAIAVIIGGVIAVREFAQAAFKFAIERRYALRARQSTLPAWPTSAVAVASDCPRRWLVTLHLRLTGTPFVLPGH